MTSLGKILLSLQNELGFSTNKEFFEYFKKRGLECNYQYFVKILKDGTTPSSTIINQIANGLNGDQASEVVLAYCTLLFPKRSFLFTHASRNKNQKSSSQVSSKVSAATELNARQIATLSSRKEHYHLFLILLLSRQPIGLTEIQELGFTKRHWNELQFADLVFIEDDYIRAITTEYRFPKDAQFEKEYLKFDSWDTQFTEDFNFESLLNKVMTRRISPRYLNVINQQIDALVGTVRLADEADPAFNTEVLHLQIKMLKGFLPG